MLRERECRYIDSAVCFFNALCSSHSSGSGEIDQDLEMIRLQILDDPNVMRQLEDVHSCYPPTL